MNTTTTQTSPYLLAAEAAIYLRCTGRALRAWVRQGRLRSRKIGNRLAFTREDLDCFTERREPTATAV